MSPTYEIIYFDGPGRAEAIRVMLHVAGIEFKDTRIAGKDWPEYKPETPLGSMPILKVDDTEYVQSLALARYAAKLAGYYPEDPLQALVVDEVMDITQDIMTSAPKKGSDNDDMFKQKRQEWQNTKLKSFFDLIEKRIQAAGGNGVVATPSVADLSIQGLVLGFQKGFFDHIDTKFVENYPGMLAACKNIMADPKVKSYYDSKK